MAYHEYLTLLQRVLTPTDLVIIRLDEDGGAFLEDGLYATQAMLTDPAGRDRLMRFLRASAAGWRYAQHNSEEALAITLTWTPLADRAHQRRMLEQVLALVQPSHKFGLLELATFWRSVDVIGRAMGNPADAAAAAHGSWTHRVWIDAGLDEERGRVLAPAVRHYLLQVVGSGWFYALGLIGTVGFALSGVMQALQRRYNLWGAFILALLLAAGGGTMRDLLVGGDRLPPFIFNDPNYIMIVFAVVLVGAGSARVLSEHAPQSRAFDRTMVLADTIGFATFAVVGAQVALMAGLGWYWIPFCAGLSCAGGGMLLDIITGREPRTFQGELYEEIAAAGGLILFAALLVANRYESVEWLVPASVIATWLLVFGTRLAVVRCGIRSYRFGASTAPARSLLGGAADAPVDCRDDVAVRIAAGESLPFLEKVPASAPGQTAPVSS
jgi:NitT/TauT family transport system substrate-binding protein